LLSWICVQELVFPGGKSAKFCAAKQSLLPKQSLVRRKNQGIRVASLGDFSPKMQILEILKACWGILKVSSKRVVLVKNMKCSLP
jgi:hypothetical protein